MAALPAEFTARFTYVTPAIPALLPASVGVYAVKTECAVPTVSDVLGVDAGSVAHAFETAIIATKETAKTNFLFNIILPTVFYILSCE